MRVGGQWGCDRPTLPISTSLQAMTTICRNNDDITISPISCHILPTTKYGLGMGLCMKCHLNIVVPQHSPKVIDCVRQRPLGRNVRDVHAWALCGRGVEEGEGRGVVARSTPGGGGGGGGGGQGYMRLYACLRSMANAHR